MPVRSAKPCSHPGCGALVQPPANRCPRHPYVRPAKKEDDFTRFYQSMEWKRIRAAAMKALPDRCDICGKPGTDTVHHVVERRNGGSDTLDNLKRIHRACHAKPHGNRGSSGGHF